MFGDSIDEVGIPVSDDGRSASLIGGGVGWARCKSSVWTGRQFAVEIQDSCSLPFSGTEHAGIRHSMVEIGLGLPLPANASPELRKRHSRVVWSSKGVISFGLFERQLIPVDDLYAEGVTPNGDIWQSCVEWPARTVFSMECDLERGSISVSTHAGDQHLLFRDVLGCGRLNLEDARPLVRLWGDTTVVRIVPPP